MILPLKPAALHCGVFGDRFGPLLSDWSATRASPRNEKEYAKHRTGKNGDGSCCTMKYARPAPAAFRVLPTHRRFRACHPRRPGFLLFLFALRKRSPARGAGRQTPRVSAPLCPGRIVRVGNRSSVVGSGLSQRWRGRHQEDGERQTHQLPEEEDEPECGRPSDRCLPGAAAVSIHRGHRRRERIPVPEDATAGLCPRHPRRSVHSHRACSNDLRAPDSPHCELAAIYLVHRGVFHAVHRWKRVVDPALGSAEPLPIGGEDRIPRFSLNNSCLTLPSWMSCLTVPATSSMGTLGP